MNQSVIRPLHRSVHLIRHAQRWAGLVRGIVVVLAVVLGLTAAYGQTQTVVALTGGGPFGLAFDTSGNLYSCAYLTGKIYKTTPIGGTITAASTTTLLVSGLNEPANLAFDSSGTLYVAQYGANKITKVNPSTGAASDFVTSGLVGPNGLAFDAAGNLYVTNQSANTISKITSAGVVSTFVSAAAGLNVPYGLTIDSAGNLYAVSEGNNTIVKITSAGVVSTYIPSSAALAGPLGIAFDSAGNLYVTSGGFAVRVNLVGGAYSSLTTVASPGNSPHALTFDSLGNLFIATYQGSGSVKTTLLPVVQSLGTTYGPLTAGTSVTITGIAFTGATAVTFGNTAATSFTVNGQFSITAVAPAGTAGVVDVKVTTPVGTSVATSLGTSGLPVAADQFIYYGVPTVTAVSPVAGLPAGGTSVTITGTNFTGATSVKFGGVAATTYTVNSATQITATAPAGTLGTTVDVTVGNPVATSATVTADNYTYENTPTVTAVSPTGGGIAAGTSVTITGTGFIGASAVKFGNTNASSYVVNSSTSITATAPAGTAGTTVHVQVTTPVGTSGTSAADNYTYYAVPTVTAVSPIASGVGGGGTITITGTGFTGATAVNFGTVTGTNVTVVSATSITVTVPAGVLGTYDVTVTTPGGTSAATGSDKFTYEGVPTVTALSPASGPLTAGTTVTLTGTNFTGATAVNFGSTAATTFIVNSSTSISATAPAGTAGSVYVTVTTPVGTSTTSTSNQYTYYAVPTVTSISPIAGPTAGGTTVTITGTGFAGLSGASAVKFGTTNATSYTLVSSTSITAVAPAGAAGTVDITVVTPGGTSATSTNDQFLYEVAPTVTSLSVNSGPVAGGTSVTLTGTNFTGASAVSFGGTAATAFTFNNATTITATAPAGTAGPVNITVTTPVGTSATAAGNQFTYYAVPTVTSVSPIAGTTAGGGTVTINGTGLTGATSVTFGSTTISSGNFVSNSGTAIVVTLPAGTAGTVDVAVTTPGGTTATSSGDKFTYETAPTVTSLSPSSGPLAAGTVVVITGTNFTGASAVSFGGTAATSFTVLSATTISATAPAGSAGPVDVQVTTPVAQSAVNQPGDQYTYTAGPAVSSISPVAGPLAGGTVVTITGTALNGASPVVKFGTNNATTFTVTSATSITATAPAGSAGTVDVTVQTVGGTSGTSTADQFTYETAPTVTAVSPTAGPLAAGTVVTITGTNLTGASSVSFGGTAASTFSVTSPTTISATAPAGSAGAVDVRVTTPIAQSAVNSPADQFTYTAAPTVTAVSPAGGAQGGGASITVTGTGFTGATAVNFGSAAATITATTATSITVTNPAAGSLGVANVTVTTPGGTSAINTSDQFTYEAAPTITGLSPAAGPLTAGTVVTITGTNFTAATAVTFGTAGAASSFTVVSPTTINATAPAGTVGSVLVTVTTPVGTSNGGTNSYAYTALPVVTSVSPAVSALTGTGTVTITGTGFTGATAVNFGTNAGTNVTVVSSTSITATVPAGSAGTVDLTVTTSGGTSATNPGDQLTYEAAPTVTAVSPSSGPLTAGTAVTITGTNFTGATAVSFGGTAASSFVVTSATSISAVAPAGSASTVDVTVTTPVSGGTTSATNAPSDSYTFAPAPTVSSLSVTAGAVAGGGTFNLTGTGFTAGSTVKFGNVTAVVTYINSTTLQVTIPAGSLGTTDVTVTTTGGTSGANTGDQFTYEGVPVITSLSAASSQLSGGTTITITGTGFTNASAVSFGGTPATAFVVTSSTSLTATVPAANSAGMVDILITNPTGTSTAIPADQFTYFGVPTVTLVSPNTGSTAGGTAVTITGTGFTGATAVKFGTTNAVSFTVTNATTITATAPAGTSGVVDVLVTTPGGTTAANTSDNFTYVAPASSGSPIPVVTTGTTTGVPVITSPLTYQSPVNQPFSYTIFATNTPTSYNAVAIAPGVFPPGIFINTFTGGITSNAPLAYGTYPLTISASNAFGTATATLIITITPIAQTITFPTPANVTTSSAPFALTASSTSGLPITYTVLSGPATVSGSTLTVTGTTGTVTIQANQAGTTMYSPAAATVSFPVTSSSPLAYFGSVSSTSGQAAAPQPNVATGSTSAAAFVNAAGTGGTIIGYLGSQNAGFVTNFSIGTGGAFSATTGSLVTSSGTSQTLTISGTVSSGTISGTIAPLGLTFSLAVDPTTGVSTPIEGYYNAGAVQASAGTAYSVVGTQNDIYVLFVSPTLISSGPGSVSNNGFTIAGTSSATIVGSVNPSTTVVAATVTSPTSGTVTTGGVASTTTLTDRLVNLSARSMVTPNVPLTAGFVITGTTAKTLVLRGVGPGLSTFGLSPSPILAHPQLTLMDSQGNVLASNTGWAGTAALTTAFASVGAFPLAATSADSALVMTLNPGLYTMKVSDAVNDSGGIALAELYDASVDPTGGTQKLINLSSRGNVMLGNGVLVCGFIVTGNSPKPVLIRGVGPTLAAYGLTGLLADPVLTLYDSSGNLVATNNDWSTPIAVNSSQVVASAATLTSTAAQVGAFPLTPASKDAAIIVTLAPGAYTAQVSGNGATTGLGLVEVYEIPQ